MADHLIIQIRDALATALTGLSITGVRVFTSRPEEKPLADNQVPSLWLQLGAEEFTEGTLHGSELEFITHRLGIACCVRQAGDYEKQLANIARDVRAAVAANRFAGGAKAIYYVGAEAPAGDGGPEVTASRWTLFFDVQYATAAAAVDVAA